MHAFNRYRWYWIQEALLAAASCCTEKWSIRMCSVQSASPACCVAAAHLRHVAVQPCGSAVQMCVTYSWAPHFFPAEAGAAPQPPMAPKLGREPGQLLLYALSSSTYGSLCFLLLMFFQLWCCILCCQHPLPVVLLVLIMEAVFPA